MEVMLKLIASIGMLTIIFLSIYFIHSNAKDSKNKRDVDAECPTSDEDEAASKFADMMVNTICLAFIIVELIKAYLIFR